MSITFDTSGHASPDPDEDSIPGAITQFHREAATSGASPAYLRVLRSGAPGIPYPITVAGQPVTIVLAHRSTGPVDQLRERQSWIELHDVVTMGDCGNVHQALPAELAVAVWTHNGHEIRARRPSTPSRTVRRAGNRLRQRLTALSPLPLLAALIQPVAGSATAVGIAVAPVLPPMHNSATPPSPIIREMTGQLTYPLPPWLPSEHPNHADAPPAPLLPAQPPADVDSLPSSAAAPTRTSAGPAPAPSKPAAATPGPAPEPTQEKDPVTTAASKQPGPAPEASPTEKPRQHANHQKKRNKHGWQRGRGHQ